MNKDNEFIKETKFYASNLRGRIEKTIKAVRDDAEELNQPQAKTMPFIPVTGSGRLHKYSNNKSPKAY